MRLMRTSDVATGVILTSNSRDYFVDILGSLTAYRRASPSGAARLQATLEPSGGKSWLALLGDWPQVRDDLDELLHACVTDDPTSGWQVHPIDSVRALAPIPRERPRIFAVGANFASHLARLQSRVTGRPVSQEEAREGQTAPWGFIVVPEVIVGDRESIVPPKGTQYLDYEAEFVAVLAEGGRDIARDDVRFWAVAPMNDFSVRDPHLGGNAFVFDKGPLSWALQKNFHTGKAMGPALRTLDGSFQLSDLTLGCEVNGKVRQKGHSSDLIWPLDSVVEHLSHFIELLPGDMIISGTPEGTAIEEGADGPFLRPGDEVVTSVDGVGRLRNRIGEWNGNPAEGDFDGV